MTSSANHHHRRPPCPISVQCLSLLSTICLSLSSLFCRRHHHRLGITPPPPSPTAPFSLSVDLSFSSWFGSDDSHAPPHPISFIFDGRFRTAQTVSSWRITLIGITVVNTRQQTERISKKKGRAATGAAAGGTLIQILQVIQNEGWGGLYSGLKPSLLGTAASQGIYYYFYQLLKNKAEATNQRRRGPDATLGMFSWLLLAAIAGSLNVLLTIPIWVVVTRMQTHTQAEKTIMEAKREALLREASKISSIDSYTQQHKLAELDSLKPRPYGVLHAGLYPCLHLLLLLHHLTRL